MYELELICPECGEMMNDDCYCEVCLRSFIEEEDGSLSQIPVMQS